MGTIEWTKERIEGLKTAEVQTFRSNAATHGRQDLVALCDEVLAGRTKTGPRRKAGRQRELDGRPLVSRKKAFEMRGVKLHNPRWSWGGIRADGSVVFTIWKIEIEQVDGEYRYQLWAPNRGGESPWSDTPGGRERLEHCKKALAKGEAEGVVIYGEQQGGDLPLGEASRVTGADPHTVLRFSVRQEKDEFWAVWPVSAK